MWPVNSILDRTDLEGEVLEDRPRDLNVVLVLPLTNLVTLGSSLFLSFGLHFLHVYYAGVSSWSELGVC